MRLQCNGYGFRGGELIGFGIAPAVLVTAASTLTARLWRFDQGQQDLELSTAAELGVGVDGRSQK